MLDRFLEALTGRRVGGALFVLAGLIVAGAVVSHDDPPPAKPKVQPARLVSVPQLGLAFAHPRTWKRTVAGQVIRLRSPDGASVMTLSSPLEGAHTLAVKRAIRDALLKRFAPARIVHDGPGMLGSRQVTTLELRGHGARKQVTRALVLVGSTTYRTYAVTLLTPARPSAKRLVEAQQILATVTFDRPRVRKRKP
ncbi:MAG: hypothetical protein QOI73_818 [Solirubrobacteraceae bacterium]|jgi:hypothetical protein|nr:hypothetical protein [Solirubrobacteraceae bacterium]